MIVIFDKPRVGKSREGGLHDGQFADTRVIVGEPGGAHLAEAGASVAFAFAHLPATAGLVQQRLAKPPREIAVERRATAAREPCAGYAWAAGLMSQIAP